MANVLDVYVFRDPHFAPAGDTLVCVADRAKMKRFIRKSELGHTFKGYAVYRRRPWPWGPTFVGVWGRRNASKFRRLLRDRGAEIQIREDAPPGTYLAYWTTCG